MPGPCQRVMKDIKRIAEAAPTIRKAGKRDNINDQNIGTGDKSILYSI